MSSQEHHVYDFDPKYVKYLGEEAKKETYFHFSMEHVKHREEDIPP